MRTTLGRASCWYSISTLLPKHHRVTPVIFRPLRESVSWQHSSGVCPFRLACREFTQTGEANSPSNLAAFGGRISYTKQQFQSLKNFRLILLYQNRAATITQVRRPAVGRLKRYINNVLNTKTIFRNDVCLCLSFDEMSKSASVECCKIAATRFPPNSHAQLFRRAITGVKFIREQCVQR